MARASAPLLSREFIEQLERLSLQASRPVRGWAAGHRRSRRTGHSVEFCDYRAYGAGDDLRYVDWNVFGRTDRLYLKLYVDEQDLCIHLLVDASASMQAGEPSKLHWALQVAAALGFVGLASLERVGLGILRERVAEGWPPTRGRNRIPPLLEYLSAVQPAGATCLNDSLERYAAHSTGGGLVVLISDLLDPAGYEKGLSALLERGLEVHVIHVLSPEEMQPALKGDVRLIDQETGEARPLWVDADTLRRYHERLRTFLEAAEAFCQGREISYHRTTSDLAPQQVVLGPFRGSLIA